MTNITHTNTKCKETPWRSSIGRRLLFEGLKNGSIPLVNDGKVSDRDILLMKPEFGSDDATNARLFSSRLRSARKRVCCDKQRALTDKIKLEHDVAILQSMRLPNDNSTPKWHGSSAQRSLALDIDNNIHKEMQPQALWKTRTEYMVFSCNVFRHHIYQEVRTRKFRNHMAARNKKY